MKRYHEGLKLLEIGNSEIRDRRELKIVKMKDRRIGIIGSRKPFGIQGSVT